jgi:hypothetical protein
VANISTSEKQLTSEKQDVLAELFKLLSEQERSLRGNLSTGGNSECVLRAKLINDLLEQLGGASNFGSPAPDTSR